jgi:hypothetical protein
MAILKPGQLASGSYTISGSFSGSFQGNGAGLNNIPSSAVVGLSSSLNIGTTPIASGTIGRVLFQGTGNVLQQSGNLFWDNTNGRLGIGTGTPTEKVHVFGGAAAIVIHSTTNESYLKYNNSTTTATIKLSNNDLKIELGSSERARIFSNGNVLIQNGGTFTDAGFKLDVNGTANVSSTLTTANVRSNSDLAHDVGSVGIRYNAVYTRLIGSGNSVFSIFNNTGTSVHIPSTNNVLIGTTTDANCKLLVSGSGISGSLNVDNTLYVSGSNVGIGTSTPIFKLSISDGTRSGGFNPSSGLNAFAFGTTTNHPLVFATNNNENARIFTTGNVAINTTTDAGFKLDVQGTARVSGQTTIGASTITNASNLLTLISNGGTCNLRVDGGNQLNSSNTIVAPALSVTNFIGAASILLNNNVRFRATTTDWLQITNSGQTANGNMSADLATFGVNYATINTSAQVQIDSTTKGFLPPRMTTTQRNAIASPAEGLMVYDTVLKRPCFYDGTSWVTL